MALSRSYRNLRLGSDEERAREAYRLAPVFAELWRSYESGTLSAAELCTVQVVVFLKERRAGRPVFRPRAGSARLSPAVGGAALRFKDLSGLKDFFDPAEWSCLEAISPAEFCRGWECLSLPAGIERALTYWHENPTAIELRRSIPSPQQMLAIQAHGRRYVTVFVGPDELKALHLDKEAFEFLLHDLEHADKFFTASSSHTGQVTFFSRLSALARTEFIAAIFSTDPLFRNQFEYLMADMNSHPAHLENYLNAILLNHFLRREGKPANGLMSSQNRALLNELLACMRGAQSPKDKLAILTSLNCKD